MSLRIDESGSSRWEWGFERVKLCRGKMCLACEARSSQVKTHWLTGGPGGVEQERGLGRVPSHSPALKAPTVHKGDRFLLS